MGRKNEDLDIEANTIIHELQGGLAGKAVDNEESPNPLLFRPLKIRLMPNEVRHIDISHILITAKPVSKSDASRLCLCCAFEGIAIKMTDPIHRDLCVGKAALRASESNTFIQSVNIPRFRWPSLKHINGGIMTKD